MKICLSTIGTDLDSAIDQVFGRCKYFLIVDSDTEQVKAIPNEAMKSMRGAGIAAAQKIIDEKAEVLICGDIGPNALNVLESSGIKVISGISDSARSALEKFKQGELK